MASLPKMTLFLPLFAFSPGRWAAKESQAIFQWLWALPKSLVCVFQGLAFQGFSRVDCPRPSTGPAPEISGFEMQPAWHLIPSDCAEGHTL